ncbi:DUF4865 family protein [Caballeronia sp. LZ034LL]|uniref:DUF4865 family protein n=1 Tax=Caballeronia sp. LZ034LL TaxID=3038567 RepID=UPI0028660183|nr:DUF4865 family protein [Caballeronia sp. LZ034LL]MDR5836073.1 DUF4865 family protein [Caballeronia sp. LZ034LL]
MLTVLYQHRLPADYDTDGLAARAQARGKFWDEVAELHFKAFLFRKDGEHGATDNRYASLYLWRHDAAFRNFLVEGRYRHVTKTFGRAAIQTQIALDARQGDGTHAGFARVEASDFPSNGDVDTFITEEVARNRDYAAQPGVVAATLSVDTAAWRLTRHVLTEREPEERASGTTYRVLYLSRPLLHLLARSDE